MNDIDVKERHDVEHEDECNEWADRALASGWKATVKVFADPGDPIEWKLESSLKGHDDYLVFDKTKDHMPKRDYYLIEFDLVDRTGLNLKFQPNPVHAFWVATGDEYDPPECPQTASYSPTIYAICDDPDGKSLTVRNDDLTRQYFRFSLGFVGDPDGREYRYDPVGDNQDGGLKAY
jgi:hypothetical protein